MNTIEHTLDQVRERASLYALGALSGSEARQFEEHLSNGCSMCADEVRAFAAVTTDLASAAAPQTPRPALRTRVLERIANDAAATESAVIKQSGARFVRSGKLRWRESNAPAVEIKVLSVDKQRGYVTQLVRMEPGAVLRPHRHVDTEESYLLEGDLLVSGVAMHAGDYCRAEAGTLHEGVITRGGCVFIAISSLRDELLA